MPAVFLLFMLAQWFISYELSKKQEQQAENRAKLQQEASTRKLEAKNKADYYRSEAANEDVNIPGGKQAYNNDMKRARWEDWRGKNSSINSDDKGVIIGGSSASTMTPSSSHQIYD